MSQKQEGTPIPLKRKVALKPDIKPEEYQEIQRRGLHYPRHPDGEKTHLTGMSVVEVANHATTDTPGGRTMEIPLKWYQNSQRRYRGRVMHAEEREDAMAARKQFADVLVERPFDRDFDQE